MLADSTQLLFQHSFSAELAELPRIKSDVLAAARQADWSGDNLDRLELVLEEGVVNIIRHAYPDNSGTIGITLMSFEDGLLLSFEDTGIPFDPCSAPVPNLEEPAEGRPIGGLGIHVMKCLTEALEYRRNAGTNVLEIILKPKCTNG